MRKEKRLIELLAITIVIIIVSVFVINKNKLNSVSTHTPDSTENWKTFVNTKNNYSFKYPDNFIIQIAGGPGIIKGDISKEDDLVMLPTDGINKNGYLTLGIGVRDLKNYTIPNTNNLHVLAKGNLRIDNENATTSQSYLYVANDNSGRHGAISYGISFIHDNKIFGLQFVEQHSDESKFTSIDQWSNKGIVDQIISSFKFTN
jgi:hypothetical protein